MDFVFFLLKDMPQMGQITLSFSHDKLSTIDSHRLEILRKPVKKAPAPLKKMGRPLKKSSKRLEAKDNGICPRSL